MSARTGARVSFPNLIPFVESSVCVSCLLFLFLCVYFSFYYCRDAYFYFVCRLSRIVRLSFFLPRCAHSLRFVLFALLAFHSLEHSCHLPVVFIVYCSSSSSYLLVFLSLVRPTFTNIILTRFSSFVRSLSFSAPLIWLLSLSSSDSSTRS